MLIHRKPKASTPLDLSPIIWLDLRDWSTIYQTDDTSTPLSALGQNVGRVQDKSGRGNHFTQATSGARPFYGKASSVERLGYSANRYLKTSSTIDLSHTSRLSAFAVGWFNNQSQPYFSVNDGTDTPTNPFFEGLSSFSSTTPQIWASMTGTVGENRVIADAAGHTNAYLSSMCWVTDPLRNNPESEVFLDGSRRIRVGSSSNNANTAFGATHTVSILARNAGGLSGSHGLVSLVFFDRLLDGGEIEYLQRWAADQYSGIGNRT